MDNLISALKSVAGPRMRELLSRLTRSRFEGGFTGAFTTAVIQSCSVTTVLVMGFVAASLMRLEQSIGKSGQCDWR
jgi:phosphate:Na+ symporter